MAENAFDSLVVAVNAKISEMNTAISDVNGAAAVASEAAQDALASAQVATAAAETAITAATAADNERTKWEGLTVSSETVEAGGDADVRLEESNGAKRLAFSIPRGNDGNDGPQGPEGKSGVSFRLSGTVLYITTED